MTKIQEQERKQQISSANRATAPSSVQSKSSKPNSVYDVKKSQTSTTSNVEGYSVERTSTKSTQKVSDKESQLLQRFNNNFPKFNFSQKTKIEFMERISGMSMKELANDKAAVDLMFSAIREAIKDLNGSKLTNINVAEQANKYFVVVKYGQYKSIAQYKGNHKFETLSQKLSRTGWSVDEYMERQFGKNRTLYGRAVDKYKALKIGMSVVEYKNKQSMQDFSKMLVNSSKDEKFRLVEAIKHLQQSNNIDDNNRVTALKMIYASLSPSDKMAFSEKFTDDKELLRIVGADANAATIQGTAHNVTRYSSAAHAKRFNECMNMTVTEIENRIAALKAKKNLTSAEKVELAKLENQLHNQYTPMQTGNTTGILANNYIEDKSLVDTILTNNTSHTNREDVMTGVAEYITTHSDEMAYSPEECTAMMDNATNGEYSQIEAKVRENMAASNNSETTGEYTNTQTTVTDDTMQSNQGYTYIENNANSNSQNNNGSESPVTNPYNRFEGTAAKTHETQNHNSKNNSDGAGQIKTDNTVDSVFNEILIEHPKNIIKSIIEGIKDSSHGSTKRINAKNEYKRSSSDVQLAVLIIARNSKSTFDELISLTSASTINKFFNSGNKGPDCDSTKKLHERQEELQKQEKRNNVKNQYGLVA